MELRNCAIAIVGGGMGGLAAASALGRIGVNVTIFEQATRFCRGFRSRRRETLQIRSV